MAVTPNEVIETGIRCWEAGASIIHCHARDAEQRPSLDYDFFARVVEGLRKHTDLIVQLSTGWRRGDLDCEGRIRHIDLAPDMMSLNIGSVNFPRGPYVNTPEDAEFWAKRMQERGVKPEIECFDMSHVEFGVRLWQRGLIDDPPFFNFVLGIKTALGFSARTLVTLVDMLPPQARWNVIGIGAEQLPATTMGILMGGNSRVGLEDNIYYSYKVLATNEQLVARVKRLADELQREVASPGEARKLLRIGEPTRTDRAQAVAFKESDH